MKTLAAIVLSLAMIPASFAGAKAKCAKKQMEISCSKVKGAKRKDFCWSGKLSNSKKSKICKSASKKRMAKSVSKKRKAKPMPKKRMKTPVASEES